MSKDKPNPKPITFYPGNHQEAAFMAELIPACIAQSGKANRSDFLRWLIVDYAREKTHIPGSGNLAAILAKYEVK